MELFKNFRIFKTLVSAMFRDRSESYIKIFADLAITSPTDYYKEGEGSLLQVVITPADDYIKLSNEAIVEKMNGRMGFETAATGTTFYFDLPEARG